MTNHDGKATPMFSSSHELPMCEGHLVSPVLSVTLHGLPALLPHTHIMWHTLHVTVTAQ